MSSANQSNVRKPNETARLLYAAACWVIVVMFAAVSACFICTSFQRPDLASSLWKISRCLMLVGVVFVALMIILDWRYLLRSFFKAEVLPGAPAWFKISNTAFHISLGVVIAIFLILQTLAVYNIVQPPIT